MLISSYFLNSTKNIVYTKKEEFYNFSANTEMQKLHKNWSLPKITSKFIEDLLKENSQSPLPRKHIKRFTYNKHKQSNSGQKSNRYTQADYRLGNNEFCKDRKSQILEVSSPFYKKISLKKVKNPKCQCHLFHANQSLQFPLAKRSPCAYHRQVIANKVIQTKKYQQNLANSLRQDHIRIHQKLDEDQLKYSSYSLENSQRIRAQKYITSKKNAQEFKMKLQKIKYEGKIQKQLNQALLKDKIDKVYNLDNENEQYEKIMQMRNKWYKEKKQWAVKILKVLHQELKQIRTLKQKLLISKQKNNDLVAISQNENILLDIEKCLAVILNNVQSIEQLLIKGNINKITTKIQEIFKKNVQIKDKSYGKKLCKKLSQIVEKFYVYPKVEQKNNEIEHKINKDLRFENININNVNQTDKSQINISELNSNFKNLNPNNFPQRVAQNIPKIQISDEKNEKSDKKVRSPKISGLSIRSRNSKRSSSSNRQDNQNSIKNSLKVSKKSSLASMAEEKQNCTQKQKTGRSMKSHRSIKSKGSTRTLKQSINFIPQPENVKKQTNNLSVKLTPHITPFLSQHVINELDEFIMAENNQDIDSDYEDEYAKEKALKFIQATKMTKQRQQKDEAQRIDYVIQYVKARIKMRQANKQIIPKKYEHIQYQKFCTQNTFKYITAMIDEFQDSKKFTFLFGQLRLKKHILDDQYIYEAIETFKGMFQTQEQFQKWKDYLFEQRNKFIFQKLDRMIDLGLRQIGEFKFQLQTINQPQSEQQRFNSKQFAIFNKVDQSQIAYQNYLQKIQRKKDSVCIIQRDLNINRKQQKNLQKNSISNEIMTQKTINSQIQSNSTKSIRYTFVQNKKSINSLKRGIGKLDKSQTSNLKIEENKKKVLKYLLKKRPQQFQELNKDVNEFSKFVKSNFTQQHSSV